MREFISLFLHLIHRSVIRVVKMSKIFSHKTLLFIPVLSLKVWKKSFALSYTIFLFLFLERFSKFVQNIQLFNQSLLEILQTLFKSVKECYNKDRKIHVI